MKNLSYNINVRKDSFYKNYLVIIRPLIDIWVSNKTGEKIHITDKPLRLLERLMFYDYKVRTENTGLSKKDRWSVITGQDIKTKIASEMNLVDTRRVNTYMSRLRKLGIITDEGIDNSFIIDPQNIKIGYQINVES